MQKRWAKITAAVAALFVIAIVLTPFLVNADTFRPRIEDQLSEAMGRKIALGHLSFSLITGSLVAENISVADDPSFSTSPFLTAKSLHIGVEVLPLLFNHQVKITKLTVESPSIQIIHGQNGIWNFSSLGGAHSTAQTPQQESTIPNLTVGELKIKNGNATVLSLPPMGKPLVYSDIDLAIQHLSFAKSFPFELTAKLPGDGSFKLTGNAGPLAQQNAADTPFHTDLQLKNLDPVAAGLVEPSQGISMVLDIDAQLASDGKNLASNGKIQAAHLQLARTGSPATQPVNVDYAISDNLSAQTGQISDISVHTGSVAVHVTGGFQHTPQATVLDLHLSAPNLPIDQVEQLLPVVGVRLPSGSSLHGGTLTANLAITGPATAATLAGPVEIDNSLLAGFDLGSKIQGLNLFKSGRGTQIQTLRATVDSTPQLTQLNGIYGVLPQLGSATGSGTVAPSGNIDFKMVATLSSNNAVGAVANQAANAVGSVGGLVGGFLHGKAKPVAAAKGNKGIPLTITGTTSDPKIRANVGAMFK